MIFFRKLALYLWRYILGILFAVLACGILALIFKASLITVQGPTIVSQLSDAIVFYFTLSASYFFLFFNYGMKHLSYNLKEFLLYITIIIVLHIIIIVAYAYSWSGIWFLSMGTASSVKLMYAGLNGIQRLIIYSDIPKIYYYKAMFIEDGCFIVFSLLGYCLGVYKRKTN